MVNIINSGFKVTFNRLNTRARIKAEVKLATDTPGNRYPVASTAIEDRSILIKKFKYAFLYSNICL